MNFKEKIAELTAGLKSTLTSESSPEQIKTISGFTTKIEELTKDYDALKDENTKLKDMVIDSVKNTGTRTPPEDDISGNKPKTMEACLEDVIAKRSKN